LPCCSRSVMTRKRRHLWEVLPQRDISKRSMT
jgi:hypothetical protein